MAVCLCWRYLGNQLNVFLHFSVCSTVFPSVCLSKNISSELKHDHLSKEVTPSLISGIGIKMIKMD